MSLKNLIPPTIIFTDLDGTLLNHHDYSFESAKPMLAFIKANDIPLIIVTSKTKDEVMLLQKKLAISTPFIVENGAGIITPHTDGYDARALGLNYDDVRNYFETYALLYKMRGFGDMSVEEVVALTGLSVSEARNAKARLFTEPFVLEDDSDLDALKLLANQDGLDVVKGGRFYHLISLGQDKAVALEKVIAQYEAKSEQKYKTIGLGDSANDLRMLERVDVPILIPQKDGRYLECEIDNVIKAKTPGALGWNQALKEYFDV